MIIPDIIADIKLYEKSKNGRGVPTPPHSFSCIIVLGHSNHDAKLLLDNVGPICPGDIKQDVPIKFLCADLVIPKIGIGTSFFLREGKHIGEGVVTEIINEHPESTVID